jgi:RNA polymerase sigma factor (TIGR02999 family)
MPKLVELLYAELRRIAAVRMRAEDPSHTLTPTALVHEAYVRLLNSAELQFQDRSHFLAVAAQAMRRILVDHARAKRAARRGGGQVAASQEYDIAIPETEDDILALDEALSRLAEMSPRQCRVVELRYFAGLTEEQVAEVLGVTRRTVNRDWQVARAWLHSQMTKG